MPQPLAGNIEVEHGPRCKHPPRWLSLAWRGVDTAMGLIENMRTLARALAGSASSDLSEGGAPPPFGGAASFLCFSPF